MREVVDDVELERPNVLRELLPNVELLPELARLVTRVPLPLRPKVLRLPPKVLRLLPPKDPPFLLSIVPPPELYPL